MIGSRFGSGCEEKNLLLCVMRLATLIFGSGERDKTISKSSAKEATLETVGELWRRETRLLSLELALEIICTCEKYRYIRVT